MLVCVCICACVCPCVCLPCPSCSTAHQRAVKRNEEQGETIRELERDYEEVKRASEQFEEDVQRKAGQAVELEDVQVSQRVGGEGVWFVGRGICL